MVSLTNHAQASAYCPCRSLVFLSFISRIALVEFSPEKLQRKWLKIAPHALDTLLLLSGIALILKEKWYLTDYTWLMVKIALLTVYIVLGMIAMRCQGGRRLLAATGAIACLILIIDIAIHKQILPN